MASSRSNWLAQLVAVTGKGMAARQAGIPRNGCPYKFNGRRGLNARRLEAWIEGWDLADRAMRDELNPYNRTGIDE
jgi:hypothetical protein